MPDWRGNYGTELGQRSAASSSSWHGLSGVNHTARALTDSRQQRKVAVRLKKHEETRKHDSETVRKSRRFSPLPAPFGCKASASYIQTPYSSFFLEKYQKGMGGEEEASWLSSLIDQADNLILTIGGYDIDTAGEKRFRD